MRTMSTVKHDTTTLNDILALQWLKKSQIIEGRLLMKHSLKLALAGATLAATASCMTVEPPKPHTEAYRGGYYDYAQPATDQYIDEEDAIEIISSDFTYEHPVVPLEPITNTVAEDTYVYAMTLKESNPHAMTQALYLAAKQGSGNAHYELARELTSGKILDKNIAAAQNHLEDAIVLNHAEAMRVLGFMNIRGDNMPVDIPAGIELLESSAQTSPRAMRELGSIYRGKSISQVKDMDKAIHYLSNGYKLGDAESAYLLGQTYREAGRNLEAVEPLSFAAGLGHAKAKRLLAELSHS